MIKWQHVDTYFLYPTNKSEIQYPKLTIFNLASKRVLAASFDPLVSYSWILAMVTHPSKKIGQNVVPCRACEVIKFLDYNLKSEEKKRIRSKIGLSKKSTFSVLTL